MSVLSGHPKANKLLFDTSPSLFLPPFKYRREITSTASINWTSIKCEIAAKKVFLPEQSISFLHFFAACSRYLNLDLHRSACLICLGSLSATSDYRWERGCHWLDLNTISHNHQNYPLANFPTNKIFFELINILLQCQEVFETSLVRVKSESRAFTDWRRRRSRVEAAEVCSPGPPWRRCPRPSSRVWSGRRSSEALSFRETFLGQRLWWGN